MCGLAGAFVFGSSDFRIEPTYLTRIRETLIHRGPDAGASWISSNGRVGLSHRRLSILDLSSSAHQPMGTEDGRYQLVFNGEIYNHAEIRAELKSLGHSTWMTDHSDTEVLLRAFQHWGVDCVHKFRGMFAFAVWDEREQELTLVRDRIGIKPLYYSVHHGRIVFASEIKALLADPQQHRRINEDGLFHYLSYLTVPAPQTLFDGIYKLSPGTFVKVRAGGDVRTVPYWDVWDHVQPQPDVSLENAAEQVLSSLRQAVRYRKVSDVPVGIFLSGGIDSTTNAYLFSEGESRPVKTFSVGYKQEYDSYRSELSYARKVASNLKADHHEVLLDESDLLSFLPKMIHLQDEPIGDPVCFPVYFVSKLARDNGVIVCQVGEGSDELFWGYPIWKTKHGLQKWNDRTRSLRWLKKWGLHGLDAVGRGQGHEYEALRRASLNQPVFWGGVDAFPHRGKWALLSDRLRKKFAGRTSWEALEPEWQRFQSKAWEPSILHWMSYCDLKLRLPELLLMRVDKMSMGVSLEARVPFLDHEFVSLAMSFPESLKTKDGRVKTLLKTAVRGVIPDEIIDRPKQGFGVPVYDWLFTRLGAHIKQEILHFCRQTDLFDLSAVTQLLEQPRGAHAWYLYNLAAWWKHFIDDSPAPSVPFDIPTASGERSQGLCAE